MNLEVWSDMLEFHINSTGSQQINRKPRKSPHWGPVNHYWSWSDLPVQSAGSSGRAGFGDWIKYAHYLSLTHPLSLYRYVYVVHLSLSSSTCTFFPLPVWFDLWTFDLCSLRLIIWSYVFLNFPFSTPSSLKLSHFPLYLYSPLSSFHTHSFSLLQPNFLSFSLTSLTHVSLSPLSLTSFLGHRNMIIIGSGCQKYWHP